MSSVTRADENLPPPETRKAGGPVTPPNTLQRPRSRLPLITSLFSALTRTKVKRLLSTGLRSGLALQQPERKPRLKLRKC